MLFCSVVEDMETGSLDNVVLYFDLVYNQNGSTSQVGGHLDKKAVPYVANREKT